MRKSMRKSMRKRDLRKRSKRVHTIRKKKSRKIRGGKKLSPAIPITQTDLTKLGKYYKRDEIFAGNQLGYRITDFYLGLNQDIINKLLIHISLYWTRKGRDPNMLDRVIEGTYNIMEDEFNESFMRDIAEKEILSIEEHENDVPIMDTQMAILQTIREITMKKRK